jgi:hypothetical protein
LTAAPAQRTTTTNWTTGRVADAYTSIWSESDAQRRRAAIAELWADGGVEYVEGTQFRGHEALDARVSQAYSEFVAGGSYLVTRADRVALFDHIIVLTIQLVATDHGTVAWAARVFLVMDEDGRIREDYQLTVQPLAA